MATEAQKRASEKYRRENVTQRVVRFSPNERDLLDHLESQENRMGYIKNLIKADMEGRVVENVRRYVFESANMGTVEFHIDGEWVGGGKDVSVMVGRLCREWSDVDFGGVDEIFQWLIDSGVEFESDRSLYFNHTYVGRVMIECDMTEDEALDRAAAMTAEDLADWKEWMMV